MPSNTIQPARGRLAGAVALCLAAACWIPATASAQPDAAGATRVDPPVPLFVVTTAGERVRGRLVSVDAVGLDLELGENDRRRLAWTELPAQRVLAIRGELLAPDDARGWLRLGALLHSLPDGAQPADRALERATRLDPALAEQAARVRRGEPIELDPPADPGEDAPAPDGQGAAPDAAPTSAPRVVGEIESRYWGELSPEVIASSLATTRAFAEKTQEVLGHPLRLHETEYFLFYSDLPDAEAARWAGLLDRMYARLADLFGLEPGRNIYRGKCLILVFQREADYHRFQAVMHQTNSAGTAGMAHGFGSGFTHVAFYRQPHEGRFAHVLVHETVHSFLHRYRSPARIPSWLNEGLAELIASELVPQSDMGDQFVRVSMQALRETRSLGGSFYEAPHIAGWQYGVANRLVAFMVGQSRSRFGAFVDGIKQGMPWGDALTERYGVSVERLTEAFGESVRVRGLTP